jgi:hypothetical protein
MTLTRAAPSGLKRRNPMISWILMLVLLILLVSALPAYPYSRSWGYRPSGVLGLLLVVVLLMAMTGRFG